MKIEITTKIKKIVGDYKRLFPDEYGLVIKQIKINRENQMTKFAEMKKSGIIERAIMETPETLNTMFNLNLTDDEMAIFRTKKAVRWFAREFPMFALSEEKYL